MMKKKWILFLFAMVVSRFTEAGPLSEFQAGISYNRMKWNYSSTQPVNILTYKRNEFYVQPCIRFSTHFIIAGSDSLPKISLTPFVGLSVFGGKGKDDTSSYKDKIAFYTMEGGLYSSVHFGKVFSIGGGIKLNYTPLILLRGYGTLNQTNDNDREWKTYVFTDSYTKFSSNAGIIVRYHPGKRFTLAAESWLGLTQLFKNKLSPLPVNVFENNYRLLLGYRFAKNKKKKNT